MCMLSRFVNTSQLIRILSENLLTLNPELMDFYSKTRINGPKFLNYQIADYDCEHINSTINY